MRPSVSRTARGARPGLGSLCSHASMVVERRARGNMCTIVDMVSVEPFAFVPEGGPAVYGFLHRPAGPGGRDRPDPRRRIGLRCALAGRTGHGIRGTRCDGPALRSPLSPGGPSWPARDPPRRYGIARASGRPSRRCDRSPRGVFAAVTPTGADRPASPWPRRQTSPSAASALVSAPSAREARRPRSAHLPDLRVPTLFVHGARDPFGTVAEIERARALDPRPHGVAAVESGHDLGQARARASLPASPSGSSRASWKFCNSDGSKWPPRFSATRPPW